MQIQELKQNKEELERRLRDFITTEVMKFQSDNAVGIYNLNIITTDTADLKGNEFLLVVGVNVDIRI